ncbi:MAG: hypothetical protein HY243_01860 [Proteobacteria bacterium]|nr:hypothetical protein [Pseudomonadota bacterium]
MTAPNCTLEAGPGSPLCDQLNRECFCISLDADLLGAAIEQKAADSEFYSRHLLSRPNLFSNVPVFLPKSEIAAMHAVVRAIEDASRLPGYPQTVLGWAPEIAAQDFGPRGVFMGYDFHLSPDGPKLIEVNTNAGGAFLNALLVDAQRGCCAAVERALMELEAAHFDDGVLAMFRNEWRLQAGSSGLRRIAIIDDRPQDQYLYPEFVLAQRFFAANGIEAVIADPAKLRYENGTLSFNGAPIDLVYNRLVDFSLEAPGHSALRAAYLDGRVVVTPNPHIHALFADKRNMTLFSDLATLGSWGLPSESLKALTSVPRTVIVSEDNATLLWETRRKLFFKPASGYGSKAVYRGDKLTKGVWSEILRGGCVAQVLATPSERMVLIDGTPEPRKVDVRLYVYDGAILITAARIYQGQTTNFRTLGGGFASVFPI